MSVYVPAKSRSGKCLSNCQTCDHKKYPDGGYCYMFRTEPEGKCYKHTGMVGPLDLLQSLIASIPKQKL